MRLGGESEPFLMRVGGKVKIYPGLLSVGGEGFRRAGEEAPGRPQTVIIGKGCQAPSAKPFTNCVHPLLSAVLNCSF